VDKQQKPTCPEKKKSFDIKYGTVKEKIPGFFQI